MQTHSIEIPFGSGCRVLALWCSRREHRHLHAHSHHCEVLWAAPGAAPCPHLPSLPSPSLPALTFPPCPHLAVPWARHRHSRWAEVAGAVRGTGSSCRAGFAQPGSVPPSGCAAGGDWLLHLAEPRRSCSSSAYPQGRGRRAAKASLTGSRWRGRSWSLHACWGEVCSSFCCKVLSVQADTWAVHVLPALSSAESLHIRCSQQGSRTLPAVSDLVLIASLALPFRWSSSCLKELKATTLSKIIISFKAILCENDCNSGALRLLVQSRYAGQYVGIL